MSDLISRQDAYEVLTEYYHHRTDVQHDALREALNKVPSAEPERMWISTADKLPENNQRVLVSIIRSDGAKRVRTGSYSSNEYFWIDNGDYWKAKEVQAWMPLVEPYKEGE